ncbi:DsbA family oxidoreductase [Frankia gtarii]|uniref:DsbA family oxidoreductase n=1 Tax=Frankia gtarii TaxID=2950102 RepID=UPI0021C13708|nr:DsbA family oxidoreductase [Frankia gtarii]
MRVDIWSDVVCPWCYIGKARFEQALAGFTHRDEVSVVFHSYELDPSLPRGESGPLREALAAKFGRPVEEIAAMENRVADAARGEGLEYTADRRSGNTFDLHRLLHLATDAGRQAEAVSALNAAHFGAGRPVFDQETAVEVFTAAGLDAAEVSRVWAGDDYADAVRADERTARDFGITGVPFFVLDDALGVSGAQPAELFTQALDQAWAHHRPA